jgi:hypothetical protein
MRHWPTATRTQLFALLDDEVKWTEAETAPYYSGTWIGPEAVRKNVFEPSNREWKTAL